MLRAVFRWTTLIAALVAVMALAATGTKRASAQMAQTAAPSSEDGDYTIFDTPQATLLLDRKSGNMWRIGYTEVSGQRYWFGTYVPREPPSSFADFQQRVRKAIRGAPREGN